MSPRRSAHRYRDGLNGIAEGRLLCNSCRNKYLIRDGIPRLYIPDDEIINISDKSKFSEFIITPESLFEAKKNCKPLNNRLFLLNKKIAKLSIICGWFSLFLAFSLLIFFRYPRRMGTLC